MADSVKIRITGDDSEFESELQQSERTAKSAAAALAQEYRKSGMEMSDAMKKAWQEIQAAQQNGTTVLINGVDTIIRKNETLVSAIKSASGNAYEPLADSAEDAKFRISDALDYIRSKTSIVVSGLKKVAPIAQTAIKGIGIVSGAAAAAWNIAGLATVKYNANLETLTTSFKVMTGSAEKAEEIVSRLNRMGAETPFETTDLVQTTQLLMQYGFAADDAIDRMSMLGDIAQGNAEAMTSIATGYAQMSSAGKVNLQDIKQMINVCHAA